MSVTKSLSLLVSLLLLSFSTARDDTMTTTSEQRWLQDTNDTTTTPTTMAPTANGTVWDGTVTVGNGTDGTDEFGGISDEGMMNMNGTDPNNIFDQPEDDGTIATDGMPCEEETECGEGYFCSAIGICEELNCANWANNTPPMNASYSEYPCVGEGAQEGTAFCGWDGNCYAYGNCESWYKFGPVAFTGYDPNDPVELTCKEYEDGYDENMNSIVFGCRPYQPGNKAPESRNWAFYFNEVCEAKPRGNDEFKCYQMRANSDYEKYQGGVARLNPQSCDREIYENEQPLYWYNIQHWQDRKEVVTKYKHGRDNTLNGDSFNENLAEKTMFSLIVSSDDAPEQTLPDPDKEDSGASRISGSFVGFWTLVGASLIVLL